ncbi:CRISPR-associated endonuclease Cas2 [Skermanella sp. TT6]|uniref:CRISPR-associated endoribonuclease Cas2 n=1 Tax=Skermanella cutis TaxID=2775420 RepID=A0ABX7BCP8_9PROT|nr:CRISPR-associated endonuclease Cas2 [Skermanella sp. TT6]QQP92185.1 CRISPR-associated endonuclease Cas2 [Skermanella sp. TT6]
MLWNEPDDEYWEDPWDEALGFDIPLRGKQPVSRYIVCYDIIHDRRRARVAECLEGWGVRVQKSVFEVVLEKQHLAVMIRQLGRLMDAKHDSVNIYPVCASCDSRRVDLGATVEKPVHQTYLIL